MNAVGLSVVCAKYPLFHLLAVLIHIAVATECAPPQAHPQPPTSTDINEQYVQHLLQNLNTTADPCEDFYEYACGNWVTHYGSTEYLDAPGYMDYKINEELLHIVRDQCDNATTGIYAKVRQYFRSCEQLTNPALNHYLQHVQTATGISWPIFREKWPFIDQEHEDEETAGHPFDWLTAIASLRAYGLNGEFIMQYVNTRLNNGSHYLIVLHQHQPRAALRPKEVEDIFVNFGMSREHSANTTLAIMKFADELNGLKLQSSETNIEAIERTEDYRASFREMTLREFMAATPTNLNWPLYFRTLLDREVDVDREMIQNVALDSQYFNQLTAILGRTSNDTIAYYLMLQLMLQLNEDLPVGKDKSLQCIKHLRGYMPLAMNFMYEEHVYGVKRKKTDAALQSIYERLRETFAQMVNENHLGLNVKERAFILAELQTMQLKIANIPTPVNRTFVEEHYARVHMNESDFYGNHLQMLRHSTRVQQEKLLNKRKPIEETFYEHNADTASSSSPVKVFDNVILVPYGYLTLPFYHPDLDALWQYSLSGFILAHEILHAYDMFHILYDGERNYQDVGIEILQHYWDFINCTGQKPDENFSENLADVSGLRLVYQAYFERVFNSLEGTANGGGSVTASSFGGHSPQQLFFVNSVQFLCANMQQISTMNVTREQLAHEMHDQRVRLNWSNFEKFAEAFQCTPGSRMHPENMCRLW